MRLEVTQSKEVNLYLWKKKQQRVRRATPRIAIIGYSLCTLVALYLDKTYELPQNIFWLSILVPTTVMLLYVWAMPWLFFLQKPKWKLTKKKFSSKDGFSVPWRMIVRWRCEDFPELEGYKKVMVFASPTFSRSIILPPGEELDTVLATLEKHVKPIKPSEGKQRTNNYNPTSR